LWSHSFLTLNTINTGEALHKHDLPILIIFLKYAHSDKFGIQLYHFGKISNYKETFMYSDYSFRLGSKRLGKGKKGLYLISTVFKVIMFLSLILVKICLYCAVIIIMHDELFMRNRSPTCQEIRGLFAFTQCERSKERILEGGAEYQGSKIMILGKVENMQYYYHCYMLQNFKKGFCDLSKESFAFCQQASKLHVPQVSGSLRTFLLQSWMVVLILISLIYLITVSAKYCATTEVLLMS